MSAAVAVAAPTTTALCQAAQLSDWRSLLSVIWDFLSLSLFSLGGATPCLMNTTPWRWINTAG